MTITRRRPVFVSVALAGLLLLTLMVTGPAAAASPGAAAGSSCDTTPVFFGLHGMGEGPSATKPLQKDWSKLIIDFDQAQNAISGAVLDAPVSYPTINVTDLSVLDLANQGAVTKGVNAGEKNLQSDLATYTKGCKVSQDKIALIGYSMGALVINKWMVDHRSEWPMVKAVVLYGDPCWVYKSTKGLARIFGVPTCGLDLSYPYPWPSDLVPFKVESWCANLDPVCGLGLNGGKGQLTAALKCAVSYCHHFDYTLGGANNYSIKNGAKFVVQQLIG
jgi:Cutinase